jgi:hypothetical protein
LIVDWANVDVEGGVLDGEGAASGGLSNLERACHANGRNFLIPSASIRNRKSAICNPASIPAILAPTVPRVFPFVPENSLFLPENSRFVPEMYRMFPDGCQTVNAFKSMA